MKKNLTLAILLFTSTMLFAQSVEITPLYGYTISGKVDRYYGTYDIKNDMLFGAILSVEIDLMSYVELSYVRTNTELLAQPAVGEWNTFGMGIEHYQAGFLREFNDGKVVPFAKAMLGTSRYVQTTRGSEAYWRFSVGIGGGLKYFFTERLGLRLHTNLMLPMEFAGGGIFCGNGGGCSGGVGFDVPVVNWELGGGLIIRVDN